MRPVIGYVFSPMTSSASGLDMLLQHVVSGSFVSLTQCATALR